MIISFFTEPEVCTRVLRALGCFVEDKSGSCFFLCNSFSSRKSMLKVFCICTGYCYLFYKRNSQYYNHESKVRKKESKQWRETS
jgi:hypothetical protein